YTDGESNAAYKSTFEGALVDEDAYPTSGNCTVPNEADKGPPYTKCLFDKQLRTELSAYVAANHLPKGPTQLYFMLLPHKVATRSSTSTRRGSTSTGSRSATSATA